MRGLSGAFVLPNSSAGAKSHLDERRLETASDVARWDRTGERDNREVRVAGVKSDRRSGSVTNNSSDKHRLPFSGKIQRTEINFCRVLAVVISAWRRGTQAPRPA